MALLQHYFLQIDRFSLSHTQSIFLSATSTFSHDRENGKGGERQRAIPFPSSSTNTSWKQAWNLVDCIHALVHPNSINNPERRERERVRAKGNERDFPCSLGEHCNDDSIFLTHRHTWYCFSLSVALRLNPFHRAIVGNRHRLSTPRTVPYIYRRENE